MTFCVLGPALLCLVKRFPSVFASWALPGKRFIHYSLYTFGQFNATWVILMPKRVSLVFRLFWETDGEILKEKLNYLNYEKSKKEFSLFREFSVPSRIWEIFQETDSPIWETDSPTRETDSPARETDLPVRESLVNDQIFRFLHLCFATPPK